MDLKLFICLYLMAIGFDIIHRVKTHLYFKWQIKNMEPAIRKHVEEVMRLLSLG